MNAPETINAPDREFLLQDIPGYEGIYAASGDGRIWSYPRSWTSGNGVRRSHPGFFLKGDVGRLGYVRVTLHSPNGRHRFLVHRLVAMAWHPNPNALPHTNHIDGNKQNNQPSNIEWCTQSHNELHAWATGLKADTPERREIRRTVAKRVNAPRRKLTSTQAVDVRARHAAGETISSIARDLVVSRSTIGRVVSDIHYAD